MNERVVVVGGGVAGLSTSLALAHRGFAVTLLEGAEHLGGKADLGRHGGIEFDTGPSVLTLPEVFEELFRRAGTTLAEHVTLRRPDPNFRYLFPSGASLDVAFELEETRKNIRSTFGARSLDEFDGFLAKAKGIWEAAKKHFIFAESPDLFGLLKRGPRAWIDLAAIDGMRSMEKAITAHVKTPELVMLLERYATYNGSDVRRAPGTLNCIAHVELALGGYAVEGGIHRLIEAIVRLLESAGVRLETGTWVERIERSASGRRVVTDRGVFDAEAVVFCGEASLLGRLIGLEPETKKEEASMSGYTAVFLGNGENEKRAAHTVVFPRDYAAEFGSIFDRGEVPRDPTIYLCSQGRCHARREEGGREPVFVMVNAPSTRERTLPASDVVFSGVREKLIAHGLLDAEDECVWTRSPVELAARFPGSDGALYGPASNDKWSAFRRQKSRVGGASGVYFAGGSGHPGGGLPLVAQSGILAADALFEDFSR